MEEEEEEEGEEGGEGGGGGEGGEGEDEEEFVRHPIYSTTQRRRLRRIREASYIQCYSKKKTKKNL
jgi:hypothetical protein